MQNVTLEHAKEHLEDLIERARRGERITITDDKIGTVCLIAEPFSYDPTARRLMDTMSPFVPLKEDRKLGRLKGILPTPPNDFFAPLTEEELKDWYGDD